MTLLFKQVIEVKHSGRATLASFGLPLPKGSVSNLSMLSLMQEDQKLEAELSARSYWVDGSLRWLNCKVLVVKSGFIDVCITQSAVNDFESRESQKLSTIEKSVIPTRKINYIAPIDLANEQIFKHVEVGLSASLSLRLKDESSPIDFQQISSKPFIGELTQSYEVNGYFRLRNKHLNVRAVWQLCNRTKEINCTLRVHNPDAAKHEGGRWDLGDPNSLYIDDFSILFTLPSNKMGVLISDDKDIQKEAVYCERDFTLRQFGSGGEHWKSSIHWDQDKCSTVSKQGYELRQAGITVASGLRANPQVVFTKAQDNLHGKDSFSLALVEFWQNFPLTLRSIEGGCCWQLFSQTTELQGGESKTWEFNGRFFSDDKDTGPGLKNEPKQYYEQSLIGLQAACCDVVYKPEYINQCQVFPQFCLSGSPTSLSRVIELGLQSEQSFFKKRERKDVFGWRHYGELDADHEAVNASEDEYFISHYNNQYDPLMGMTVQFLHSGELRWLALIKPLSRHIQDIDIYDTDRDKAEYNGGLMWHTDHYLSAETCTHRSNSKYHEHAYDGFLGGGGPGGQHCYTTGLAMQYWLFDDQQAKQKVEQLCCWVRNFYNGSGSILERSFRLLSIDLKPKRLTNIGIKAPGYKYPLDRGTANFVNALIDQYDLSANADILYEAGDVIRQTCHPNEDISLRGLNNIENTWFYTVFLQAVLRYVLVKESIDDIDDNYWYARHAFMHYGEWMLRYERFYLDTPEELEFPNDTWCAQELRKANLFYYFYYFSADKNQGYLRKAEAFYAYIAERLHVSKEAHFTRVLSILMQNDGVQQRFKDDTPRSHISFRSVEYGEAPSFSLGNTLNQYFRDIWHLLGHFSLNKEYRWLVIRLKSAFL